MPNGKIGVSKKGKPRPFSTYWCFDWLMWPHFENITCQAERQKNNNNSRKKERRQCDIIVNRRRFSPSLVHQSALSHIGPGLLMLIWCGDCVDVTLAVANGGCICYMRATHIVQCSAHTFLQARWWCCCKNIKLIWIRAEDALHWYQIMRCPENIAIIRRHKSIERDDLALLSSLSFWSCIRFDRPANATLHEYIMHINPHIIASQYIIWNARINTVRKSWFQYQFAMMSEWCQCIAATKTMRSYK